MICMNLCVQHILLRHEELKERARQLLEQARKDAVRGSAPQPPTSLNISNHPTKVKQKLTHWSAWIQFATRPCP